MTSFLAAEDIVHHLLDYTQTAGLTAHQWLLVAIAVFTIVLFTVMARRTTEVPPKKGFFALLEFTLELGELFLGKEGVLRGGTVAFLQFLGAVLGGGEGTFQLALLLLEGGE